MHASHNRHSIKCLNSVAVAARLWLPTLLESVEAEIVPNIDLLNCKAAIDCLSNSTSAKTKLIWEGRLEELNLSINMHSNFAWLWVHIYTVLHLFIDIACFSWFDNHFNPCFGVFTQRPISANVSIQTFQMCVRACVRVAHAVFLKFPQSHFAPWVMLIGKYSSASLKLFSCEGICAINLQYCACGVEKADGNNIVLLILMCRNTDLLLLWAHTVSWLLWLSHARDD